MRKSKKYCSNCKEQLKPRRVKNELVDYTTKNVSLFLGEALSDLERLDKASMCEKCYDLEYG